MGVMVCAGGCGGCFHMLSISFLRHLLGNRPKVRERPTKLVSLG